MSPIRSAPTIPSPHVLALCAALTAAPLDEGTDWFDASNLEITSIDIGNAATNVIPGEALVRFNVRFNDALDAGYA